MQRWTLHKKMTERVSYMDYDAFCARLHGLAMYRAEHLRRQRLALLCALRRRLPRDVLRWLVESYIT